MEETLGEALGGFEAALTAWKTALGGFPGLQARLFDNTAEWEKLLRYKLLPHLEGEGCLVVAAAGGTNTGKSTIFNLLLGRDISPVRSTAAATCRPLMAASPHRYAQCLEGRLMPEFRPLALENSEALVSGTAPEDALFVASDESLPDRLVLLDIPDVDSIDQQNWEVAENIQASGDVLIAVLTGEKYKDDRVIAFFRRARAAGRVIVPLMNKANPENDFAVARAQIGDFAREIGFDGVTRFAVGHDFGLAKHLSAPIEPLDGQPPLRAYLESLDAAGIKAQVYRESVAHFVSQTGGFLERAQEIFSLIAGVEREFEHHAGHCAERYDPQPDESVGELLHEYITARRGRISRSVSALGARIGRNLAPISAYALRAVRERAALDVSVPEPTPGELAQQTVKTIERYTCDFLRDLIQTARNLSEPARGIVSQALEFLDADEAIEAVTARMAAPEELSESFRAHVRQTLERWWQERPLRRFLLQELDALLLFSPAAVAVPIAIHTGGVGAPEMAAAISPLAGVFFARIMEHQLADQWLDLIGPWRVEQQARFRAALEEDILDRCLTPLRRALDAFGPDTLETLRRHRESCRKAC